MLRVHRMLNNASSRMRLFYYEYFVKTTAILYDLFVKMETLSVCIDLRLLSLAMTTCRTVSAKLRISLRIIDGQTRTRNIVMIPDTVRVSLVVQ